jgi:hypothetical protein
MLLTPGPSFVFSDGDSVRTPGDGMEETHQDGVGAADVPGMTHDAPALSTSWHSSACGDLSHLAKLPVFQDGDSLALSPAPPVAPGAIEKLDSDEGASPSRNSPRPELASSTSLRADADYVADGFRLSLMKAQQRQAEKETAAREKALEQERRRASLQRLEVCGSLRILSVVVVARQVCVPADV